MTRQDKLNQIRKACIAANPEKFTCPVCEDKTWWEGVMPNPSLADVLLAIRQTREGIFKVFIGKSVIQFTDNEERGLFTWDLYKDSLTDQSEETITFIHNLLFK